ncbi:DUF3443 domain-containing protein [Paraburkholderia ginsengisoli]|uniref:DUF3443 domain-containing protein n=1 Tax=Paraburkholderia ginsengisoli TaxID=311231 RepID=A0A7T4T9W4_9BURK|nr:DUF3443 domain-containing protein [Paraburkholderia ginsengisoli]QQC65430.1 DUF3443 domain-containing protein [Paraburkholderia ginsengisoli]
MNNMKKTLWPAAAILAIATIALAACGGGSASSSDVHWDAQPDWPIGSNTSNDSGSSTPAGDNTMPVRVDKSSNNVNVLLASIKVCVPGSQSPDQCVTVDNMLVDTGSTGVRIAARAIPSIAPLLLTQVGAADDASGALPIAECMPFASGYTWGSVKRADIGMGGKTASNLPIQLIDDGAFDIPDSCTDYGGSDMGALPDLADLADYSINGIIGIDNFTSDSADAVKTAIPGNYYYCTAKDNCISTRVVATKQVANPVAAFATDNNGTVIRLPALTAGGQTSVTGQLVFGVNTRQNNAMPARPTVLAVDKHGTFTTQYQGQVFNRSAIDSGTNNYAFGDQAITHDPDALWYLPPGTLQLTATMEPTDGSSAPVQMPFSIGNAYDLMATGNAALDNVGSYFAGTTGNRMFLWGLPFFYGRSVYTVIGAAKIGQRTGPFVAF